MTGALRDLRQAVRWLQASPGFALTAIATLAVGIGASTAVFSMVNAVLLRPLPFPDAERLALVYGVKPQEGDGLLPLSQPDFEDFRAANRSFDRLAVWAPGRSTITGRGPAELVQFALVSADLLAVLGVAPAHGRGFRSQDDTRGQPPVAIVSARLATRLFGDAGDAVGQALTLDGDPLTVVGVLPADFRFLDFPNDTDVWLPLGQDAFAARPYAREVRSLGAIGRLRDGVDIAAAVEEAATIAADLRRKHPDANAGRSLTVVSLHAQASAHARRGVLVLLGAVVSVLLIACANVASLLLARGTGRRRELAVRGAVGASRWHLVRQLFVEALLLAAVGGALGVVLTVWTTDALALVPLSSPSFFTPYTISPGDVVIDRRVLIFALAATVGAALLFGTLPALQASTLDLRTDLTDGTRPGRPTARRTREALVIVETAAALMLVVGAGLFLQSFLRLQGAELGFTPARAIAFDIQLSPARMEPPGGGADEVARLAGGLAQLPGVDAVGASEFLPFSGLDGSTGIFVEGADPAPAQVERRAHYRSVTPDYFRAMGIRVLAGRVFTASDSMAAPRVALINETMAKRFWPAGSPIGRRVALNLESLRFFRGRPPALDPSLGMREIVGVVADTRHGGIDAAPVPEMYVPLSQRPVPHVTMVVRSSDASLLGEPTIRQAVAAVDPDQPVANIRPLAALVDTSLARPRLTTALIALFGGIALLLSVVGLYGVLAFTVSARRRELGIRMALGMAAADGARLVLADGLRVACVGIALGLAGSVGLRRVLGAALPDMPAGDLPTYAAVATLLLVTSVAASWLPARRAMAVDPAAVLRQG